MAGAAFPMFGRKSSKHWKKLPPRFQVLAKSGRKNMGAGFLLRLGFGGQVAYFQGLERVAVQGELAGCGADTPVCPFAQSFEQTSLRRGRQECPPHRKPPSDGANPNL